MKIKNGICRYVYDSRGLATVEVEIELEDGTKGRGSAPRGSTTGHYDIPYCETYDNGIDYCPKLTGNKECFQKFIHPNIVNKNIQNVKEIENELYLIPEVRECGNTLVAISYALWETYSLYEKKPVWKLISNIEKKKGKVKHLVNVIDGDPDSKLRGFEFLIVSEEEITFDSLYEIANMKQDLIYEIKSKDYRVSNSRQGAIVIQTNDFYKVMDFLFEMLKKSKWTFAKSCSIGLDLAMTDRYDKISDLYDVPWSKKMNCDELIETYCSWAEKYNVTYLEDAFSDEQPEMWRRFMSKKPQKVNVFGDDFFSTNLERIKKYRKCANGIVIKPNQIGTVSKAIEVMSFAEEVGIQAAFSQRTSETENTIISHLAMASNNSYLKAGGLDRLERIAKYNEVLRYE